MRSSRSAAAAGAMTSFATGSERVQRDSLSSFHLTQSLLCTLEGAGDSVEDFDDRCGVRRRLFKSCAQERTSQGPRVHVSPLGKLVELHGMTFVQLDVESSGLLSHGPSGARSVYFRNITAHVVQEQQYADGPHQGDGRLGHLMLQDGGDRTTAHNNRFALRRAGARLGRQRQMCCRASIVEWRHTRADARASRT